MAIQSQPPRSVSFQVDSYRSKHVSRTAKMRQKHWVRQFDVNALSYLGVEIWTRILRHLVVPVPPPGGTIRWKRHGKQDSLVKCMRVCKVFHELCTPLLYSTHFIRDMGRGDLVTKSVSDDTITHPASDIVATTALPETKETDTIDLTHIIAPAAYLPYIKHLYITWAPPIDGRDALFSPFPYPPNISRVHINAHTITVPPEMFHAIHGISKGLLPNEAVTKAPRPHAYTYRPLHMCDRFLGHLPDSIPVCVPGVDFAVHLNTAFILRSASPHYARIPTRGNGNTSSGGTWSFAIRISLIKKYAPSPSPLPACLTTIVDIPMAVIMRLGNKMINGKTALISIKLDVFVDHLTRPDPIDLLRFHQKGEEEIQMLMEWDRWERWVRKGRAGLAAEEALDRVKVTLHGGDEGCVCECCGGRRK